MTRLIDLIYKADYQREFGVLVDALEQRIAVVWQGVTDLLHEVSDLDQEVATLSQGFTDVTQEVDALEQRIDPSLDEASLLTLDYNLLPDGTLRVVIGLGLYILDMTSTAAVDHASVLDTGLPVGRWLVYTGGAAHYYRVSGVSSTVQTDPNDGAAWVTVGSVYLDPMGLSNPTFTLHADLEVVEAVPSTVQAEVRLLDSTYTEVGLVSSTLGGATSYPEHVTAMLGNLSAGTYLLQLRRHGGSPGDLALAHSVFVFVAWV